MAPYPFRADAHQAIARAKALVAEATGLPQLQYAALEVRLAIEALTYARAQALKDHLPPSELGTWLPGKVLNVLDDLDPLGGSGVKVEVAKGPPGSPLENDFFELGTETPLSIKPVKKHYNAVGNRLHMPTLEQLELNGPHDPDSLRNTLTAAIDYLETVLASPIFNLNIMALRPHHRCERCGFRIPAPEASKTEVACPECKLGHDLSCGSGGVEWHAQKSRMKCSNPECDRDLITYTADLKPGLVVTCPACSSDTQVVLGTRAPPGADGDGAPPLQIKDA